MKKLFSASRTTGRVNVSGGSGIYNITLSSDKVEENLKFLGK